MNFSFVFLFAAFLCPLMQAQTLQYYFGNLHAHTGFSDGNKDSVQSHVSTPAGSYQFAKQSLHLDFLGIAEHNHYSAPKNPGFKKQNFQNGLNMAAAANQDGMFAALFGMEWGVSSAYNGHVIIYGYPRLIGWENNVPGVSGNNYEEFNDKNDYAGLFSKLKNNKSCFAYLAHPNFNDFSSNGTTGGALANGSYIADYDSVIVGVPLRSGLAFSTAENYLDFPLGDYFAYYKKMLFLGYHLGIGYDHDNHYTTFGRSNAGRLVVLASDLSPASIITAMKQKQFYGSDDWNAKVDFQINGQRMGAVMFDQRYPDIGVVHRDDDGELADSIKVWKGSKNEGFLWAEVVHTSLNSNTMVFTDSAVAAGKEYYYFIEIKQKDGDWIVTSPIWFNALAPLHATNSMVESAYRIYPNPANDKLYISTAQNTFYQLQLHHVNGQLLFIQNLSSCDSTVLLDQLPAGIYVLSLLSEKGIVRQRLVVTP